jgi:hypothetical protein
MPKLSSDLRLKAGRVVPSFPVSLASAPVLISLLKYENIVCTNNETSDKIRVIVRQMRDKTIDLKELEYRPHSAWGNDKRLGSKVQRGSEKNREGNV